MKKNIFKISALSALAVTGVVTPIIAFATSCGGKQKTTGDWVETIKKLNEAISSKTFNTMSDMLSYLNEKNIDLQTMTVSSSNVQYVWDKPQNKIFLLNGDGSVFYKPDNYTPSANKAAIWKMVKAKTSTKLFSSNSDATVYADSFNETTPYSQYLRDGEKFDSSLTFCSGLDTGSHEKLTLTYNKAASESTEPVVINTMKSSLEVKGSWSDVNHYGNLTELTVETLDEGNQKSYNEYGTVDAAIKVKKGNITAQAGCDINSVVVTADNVDDVKINVTDKSAVGSVCATNEYVAQSISQVITTTGSPEVTPTEVTDPVSEPSKSGRFYSGFGTEKSPWTIKTAEQLKNFAEEVKTGVFPAEGQTNWYFNLIDDIDLKDEVNPWTPVGTFTAPFKGIFNGCGFKISNLKVTTPSSHVDTATSQNPETFTGFMGMFGFVEGETNSSFNTDSRNDIWKSQEKELDKTLFSEDKYKTVIKNLTLDKVYIKSSTNDSTQENGALVGRASNAYFDNIHVNSGEVYGKKAIGGIVGAVNASVFNNCSTGIYKGNEQTNLNVTADKYHVGGLAGACVYENEMNIYDSGEAFIGCTNHAIVKQNNNSGNGGFCGGLVGVCQQDAVPTQEKPNNGRGYTVFEDCINTGSVHAEAGNAAGFSMARRAWIYNRCVNTGNISNTNSGHASGLSLGGIGYYGTALCNECSNSGTISGWSDYMSGILADATSGNLDHGGMDGCSNTGELNAANENCVKSSLASGQISLILKNTTFNDVNELNNAISPLGGTAIHIELQNVKVTNPNVGTLTLPGPVGSIVSDTHVADVMNIASRSASALSIDIPGLNINVAGDCPNADIRDNGANSTLTINQNCKCAAAAVGGENSKIINNGTISGTMSIDSYSTYGENNGTCGGVSFGGSYLSFGHGSKKFINNGTVKRIATRDNQHVLSSIGGSDCSIEIDNYGSIEYDRSVNNYCGYLMCLYNTGTIVFKTYEDSSFITNDPGNRTLAPVKNHMNIYYNRNAEFTVNGETKQWTSLRITGLVDVEEIQSLI